MVRFVSWTSENLQGQFLEKSYFDVLLTPKVRYYLMTPSLTARQASWRKSGQNRVRSTGKAAERIFKKIVFSCSFDPADTQASNQASKQSSKQFLVTGLFSTRKRIWTMLSVNGRYESAVELSCLMESKIKQYRYVQCEMKKRMLITTFNTSTEYSIVVLASKYV